MLRGSGNAFDSLGIVNSSRARAPRGTVFSTNGRAERPSVKKSEGQSGRSLGCSAMSCFRLQPATQKSEAASTARKSKVLVIFDLDDMRGVKTVEKARRFGEIEFRIARFDAQKKTVAGGVLDETVHIEERMMRAREPVQRQHAKNGGECGAEHGQFKGDGNEGGPTVQRASAHVERICEDADPILKEKATQATCQATNQRDQRHVVSLQSERFGEPLNRKRGVGFDAAIAGLASFLHGVDKRVRSRKLGHHPVDM